MARYRLPEALGGGEVEFFASAPDNAEYWDVVVPGGGPQFQIHKNWLTEIKPPLPEEPPINAVVLIAGEAVQRFDEEGYPQSWAGVGSKKRYTWVQLCDLALPGVPVRLVPDPFAKPVELPWEIKDREGYGLGVYESQRPWAAARVGRGDECVDLTSGECRGMARVLMAAADAADKEQS